MKKSISATGQSEAGRPDRAEDAKPSQDGRAAMISGIKDIAPEEKALRAKRPPSLREPKSKADGPKAPKGEKLRFVGMEEVAERTTFCPAAIYKKVKEGLFPPQIHIGPKKVAWAASEVEEWMRARQAGMGDDEMRGLVSQLVAKRELPARPDRGNRLKDTQKAMADRQLRFLTRDEVVEKTTISKSTIHEMIKESLFPRQVRLRPERVAWSEWEVEEWMRACLSGWSDAEIRALVRRLAAEREQPEKPESRMDHYFQRATDLLLSLYTSKTFDPPKSIDWGIPGIPVFAIPPAPRR
ncbi:MAG: AlpA family transcriptional regulator [Holophagales bacterium]|jgi:prophage regulatory protein|nr:AlpA family transcriptional regulator [Holophagales bacterium]